MIKKRFFVTILIVFSSFFNAVYAQQTVFNVPSADVTENKHIFLQQEAQFRAWQPGPFFLGSTYASYGIGHNTEITATLFNVGAPATNNITLGTGFKSAMPIAGLKDKYPKREYKFTLGSEVLSSLEGQGAGNWTYGHLSGRVPKVNTRLTGGVSYGTKQVFGTNQAVFIGAIEQPVTKRLTLISDWFSGSEHFAGFLITGVSYAYPKDKTLYAGYQIPNSSQCGKSGFVIQFAKIF
ncbi:MAG: hypothetical protein WCF95_06445 [bacterium]